MCPDLLSLVRSLLMSRRPAAVAGFVVAVVVDAVEGLALGALAHVGEKVLEPVGA
jgi:hypothetical protein